MAIGFYFWGATYCGRCGKVALSKLHPTAVTAPQAHVLHQNVGLDEGSITMRRFVVKL